MNKFKYKLTEQDEPQSGGEENGLKGINIEQELTLTTKNDLTADEVLAILKDPKYLSGVYTSKSKELLDLETKVFGDKVTNPRHVKTNKNIYDENGIKLYQEIEKVAGGKFERGAGKFVTQKDDKGKELFVFPIKSPSNLDLVKKYLGEKSKTQIKPKVVNNNTLKFPLSDKSDLEKILSNAEKAKVISGKDYSLEKTDKLDETQTVKMSKEETQIREIIKRILKEENQLFNISPDLAFRIYNILKEKYSQIGDDYPLKSEFFNFLNDKLK